VAENCRVAPTASEGFPGVIEIDAIGGATDRFVLAVVVPYAAVMEAVPVALPVASPVALIDAIEGALELHVTKAVRSLVPPLVYVPVARKATEDPLTTTALSGAIVIAVSWDAGTVSVAVPQIEPAHALTVALPAATAYTAPELVESLVTVTIVESEELQEAETSVCTLPSLKDPMAVKGCAVPTGMAELLGFTEIDTRAGGVVVAGWYNSAAPKALKLLSNPPATRTLPLFKRVAVWNVRAVVTLPTVVKLPAAGS
jgi:hypothetical protein